jgi:hypothetical protein
LTKNSSTTGELGLLINYKLLSLDSQKSLFSGELTLGYSSTTSFSGIVEFSDFSSFKLFCSVEEF